MAHFICYEVIDGERQLGGKGVEACNGKQAGEEYASCLALEAGYGGSHWIIDVTGENGTTRWKVTGKLRLVWDAVEV